MQTQKEVAGRKCLGQAGKREHQVRQVETRSVIRLAPPNPARVKKIPHGYKIIIGERKIS
jgi:hypothetical protein